MDRRETLARLLVLGAVAISSAAQSQSRPRLWQIGFLGELTSRDSDPYRDAFLKGMEDRGYLAGRDFVLLERLAEGHNERLPGLASDLVRHNVDIILAGTTFAASAAQKATTTIPIVFLLVSDPVKSGFAESVGRPGRNLTGLSNFAGDLTAKRLELLKELMPRLSRVALLVNPDNPLHEGNVQRLQPVAKSLGLLLLGMNAKTENDIEPAFAAMIRERVGAVLISGDTYHFGQRRQIAQATIKYGIPSMSPFGDFVELGGLVSYGVDLLDPCRRAASYVDKILKGAKPGDLPIEQPTKFEMAINKKTAKALRIAVPQAVLLRADRVIE